MCGMERVCTCTRNKLGGGKLILEFYSVFRVAEVRRQERHFALEVNMSTTCSTLK